MSENISPTRLHPCLRRGSDSRNRRCFLNMCCLRPCRPLVKRIPPDRCENAAHLTISVDSPRFCADARYRTITPRRKWVRRRRSSRVSARSSTVWWERGRSCRPDAKAWRKNCWTASPTLAPRSSNAATATLQVAMTKANETGRALFAIAGRQRP